MSIKASEVIVTFSLSVVACVPRRLACEQALCLGKKIARKGKGKAFRFSLSLVPRSTKGLFTGYTQAISVAKQCTRRIAAGKNLVHGDMHFLF